jgi:hypothetical protein
VRCDPKTPAGRCLAFGRVRATTIMPHMRQDLHWLTFPARAGSYSRDWMVDALCECINAKTTKYAAKPTGMVSSSSCCITSRPSYQHARARYRFRRCRSRESGGCAGWEFRWRYSTRFLSLCRSRMGSMRFNSIPKSDSEIKRGLPLVISLTLQTPRHACSARKI